MRHDSELFRVLSPEKVTPLDMGKVLSIINNDFHPTLTAKEIDVFEGAVAILQGYLPSLIQVGNDLKNLPIRTNEWFLALNYLNSYIYILNTTLFKPENVRLHNYHLSKKGGAK